MLREPLKPLTHRRSMARLKDNFWVLITNPSSIQCNDSEQSRRALSEWCQDHRNSYIEWMQLRKECQGLGFNEFITFALDTGERFRIAIDHRSATQIAFTKISDDQCPRSLSEHQSSCLIDLNFNGSVMFGSDRIVSLCQDIIRYIPGHGFSSLYNSYFYARTIILLILCERCEWYETYIWDVKQRPPPSRAEDVTNRAWLRKYIRPFNGIRADSERSLVILKQPLANLESVSANKLAIKISIVQSMHLNKMEESDTGSLQRYLSDLIYQHGIWYGRPFEHRTKEIEWEIKEAMNEIWRNRFNTMYTGDQKIHHTSIHAGSTEDLVPSRQKLVHRLRVPVRRRPAGGRIPVNQAT
ncbi:hypothetical protein RSOLAG22IIIB_12007 [Rhizoctonia solani]|uniref:Uncharacterized protein n=1 Tax=Rhizoctonia solani TaxID=456999 RepID=A0A0K6GB14_9AGAM|nr:hypothetical protein RSOLAG22IIIB_12007 [Rhizoctonia solani]